MATQHQRSLTDRLVLLSTVVTAVSGVLLALTNLNDSLRRARDSLLLVPSNVAWAVAVGLLVASVAVVKATAKPSRPGRRDAFRLRPDRIEHLHGREDDVDRLIRLLHDHQQVNLIGESGAGKSALLRGGVIPRLVGSQLIPIYVDTLGKDWIKGPESAILAALAAVSRLGDARGLPDASNGAASSGRRLLLIFDQFDDYESAHPDRFITSLNRTFISAGELVQSNPFWHVVRELVSADIVHCLFVTRTDSAAGLECVRFAEPRVYLLDRLRTAAADELLDHLTDDSEGLRPAIELPEHGWLALRDRLVRDLSVDGSVLPAQMTLVLAGLGNFRYLTVREYRRRGGLHGVEAAEVEWHIFNTVRYLGITKSEALAILLTMVDREARKTHARTLSEIVGAITSLQPDTVRSVLHEWETKDLLRRRVDSDTGDVVWLLDHDYLSNAVLATEERMNAASILVRDAAAEFESATSVFRRWRTLLTPVQQVSTWIYRLKGQSKFGDHKSFIALSTVRFLPYLAVGLIIGLVAYQRHVLQYERAAEALLQDFSIKAGQPGADTLWMLAEAAPETKLYFLRSGLRSITAANQVRPQLGPALHAIVGADPALRERTHSLLREYALSRLEPLPIRVAAVRGLHEVADIDSDVMGAALAFPLESDLFAGPSAAIDENDWIRVVRDETPDHLAPVAERLLERLNRVEELLVSGRAAYTDSRPYDLGVEANTPSTEPLNSQGLDATINQAADEHRALDGAVGRLQDKTDVVRRLVDRVEAATTILESTSRASFLFDVNLSSNQRARVKDHLLGLLSFSHSAADMLHALYVARRFSSSDLSVQQRLLVKRALEDLPAAELRCTWSVTAASVLLGDELTSNGADYLLDRIARSQDAPCQSKEAEVVVAVLMRRLDRSDGAHDMLGFGRPNVRQKQAVVTPAESASAGTADDENLMGRPDEILRLSNSVMRARRAGSDTASIERQITEILQAWATDKQRDLALTDVVRATSSLNERIPAPIVINLLRKCRTLFKSVSAETYLEVQRILRLRLESEETQPAHSEPSAAAPITLRTRDTTTEIIGRALEGEIRSLSLNRATAFAEDLLDHRPDRDTEDMLRHFCQTTSHGGDLQVIFRRRLHAAGTDSDAEKAVIGLLSLPRIPLQEYVDVFRTPTCGTRCRARAVMFSAERVGKKFDDDWAFLEWAGTQFLVVSGTPRRQGGDQ
jgi:hypothetical protein